MGIVNFTNLDFDQIKESIKQYLRSNSNFTDYDFEGSNLSTIIDTLAYTSYVSAFNANMITNEVFIDSATLRENVVSLAKHVGYVPRSRNSSRARVSFIVDATATEDRPVYMVLRKGLVATTKSQFAGKNYIFSCPDDVLSPVVNGLARFDNVEIYEGVYIEQRFLVNTIIPNQQFILDNANIDTSTLRVSVRESEDSTIVTTFNLCSDFCQLNKDSKIYFLQEIEDQRYELIFGDGIFGKALEDGNVVEVSYIISQAGEEANNVSAFTYAGKLYTNNNDFVASGVSLLTTVTPSQGGREIESVDSIRKYAPRLYAAQGRAVTSSDYESIVARVYPEAESVSVFGGEELDPPQFGKVFITIKPYEDEILPLTIKNNIKDSLRQYAVAGIVPEIIDLKYLYIEYDSSVYYNNNQISSVETVRSRVVDSIGQYADSTELNKYGARFKYSKFLKIIDETDISITSNITKINLRRDLKAAINSLAEYELCFGNEIHIGKSMGYNIKSSGFKVADVLDTVYISDIPINSVKGEILLFKMSGSTPVPVKRRFGEIDYVKGEILIYPTVILSTVKSKFNTQVIEISCIPKSNDVVGLQDLYLQLDVSNSMLNMVRDSISSGEDASGSSYISSSSYSNGNFIRQ